MKWIRLQTSYLDHPKTVDLPPSSVVLHLAILLYCMEQRTLGLITEGAVRTRRCYSRKSLQLLLDRGLLHACAEGYTVHDWQQWNLSDSTAAERQRRHRARLASRDKSVTDTVTRPVTNRDETVTLARADARARNEYEYEYKPLAAHSATGGDPARARGEPPTGPAARPSVGAAAARRDDLDLERINPAAALSEIREAM